MAKTKEAADGADQTETKVQAEAAPEVDNAKLSERLEALEKQQQKLAEQQAKIDAERAALAQALDRPRSQPARIKLRSKAFDPQKALARLADIFPDDGTRQAPTSVTVKTYRVSPLGVGQNGLPIAEVSNCSDEGDAKAAYALATGRQVALEVEEIGRQEFTRATADPASAGA